MGFIMLENLEFSFENDFQKLHLEVKVSHSSLESSKQKTGHNIEYKIINSSGVDFVCAFDRTSDCASDCVSETWISFQGDSAKWLERFDDIDIQEWNSFYDTAHNPFSSFETKWSLCIEAEKKEDDTSLAFSKTKNENSRKTKTIYGHNLYPVDFDRFLDLLKDLLQIPVLLLEL